MGQAGAGEMALYVRLSRDRHYRTDDEFDLLLHPTGPVHGWTNAGEARESKPPTCMMQVLAALRGRREFTLSKIAELTGQNITHVSAAIRELRAAEKVEKVKRGPDGRLLFRYLM